MKNYQIRPHTEIVFSVSDIAKNLPFYLEGLKMHIKYEGQAEMDEFYGISTHAAKDVLLVRGDEPYGNIRLLEFKGVSQELIRPNGRIWDVGGIYDFDVRAIEIEETMRQLRKYDWRGHGESVTYSTGVLSLNEGFLRGHDDIVMALIERTLPPIPNENNETGVSSNVFNSAMIVSDFERSKHFLTEILGFHIYHEDEVHWNEGPNILNLPHNMVDKGVLKLCMAQPQKDVPVVIEVAHFPFLKGMDYSAKAHPPNLGIMSFRFPVEGIAAFYDYIENQEVTICSPLQQIEIKPYGTADAFAITTPDGAWMEFYEVK